MHAGTVCRCAHRPTVQSCSINCVEELFTQAIWPTLKKPSLAIFPQSSNRASSLQLVLWFGFFFKHQGLTLWWQESHSPGRSRGKHRRPGQPTGTLLCLAVLGFLWWFLQWGWVVGQPVAAGDATLLLLLTGHPRSPRASCEQTAAPLPHCPGMSAACAPGGFYSAQRITSLRPPGSRRGERRGAAGTQPGSTQDPRGLPRDTATPGWASTAGGGTTRSCTGLSPSNPRWAWPLQSRSPRPPRQTLSGGIFPNAIILNVKRQTPGTWSPAAQHHRGDFISHLHPSEHLQQPLQEDSAMPDQTMVAPLQMTCSPSGHQERLSCREQDEEEEGSIPRQRL